MPTVNVRYMVDDVEAAIEFYSTRLGFTLLAKTLPAFADVAFGDFDCYSAGPRARLAAQCPTAAGPALADGTVFT